MIRDGDQLVLTRTEFSLLELFLRNPRQVLTRSVIFDRVWGYDFGYGSNSLDVYISYLRKKTEAGGKSRLIHTVRGVGLRVARAVAVSIRARLALGAAAAVAIAIVLASVVVYFLVRNELRAQVDRSLQSEAHSDRAGSRSRTRPTPTRRTSTPSTFRRRSSRGTSSSSATTGGSTSRRAISRPARSCR